MSDLFDSDSPLKKAFPGFKRYIVTWHCDVIKLGKKKTNLGICSKTGGVAFACSDYLQPLVIQDIKTSDSGCDDEKWCLDIDCPHNKADPKYFKNYGIKTHHELENVHRHLEEWTRQAELKNAEPNVTLLYKEPAINVKKASKQ